MEKKTNTNQSRHLKLATLLFFVLGAFLSKAQNARTALESISSDKNTTAQQKDQLKAQWIETHKEEYQKMGGKINASEPSKSSISVNSENAKTVEPVKIQLKDNYSPAVSPYSEASIAKSNTNNLNQSNNIYIEIKTEKEKNEWIKNNKSLYEGSSAKSSKIHVSKTDFNALPAEKQNAMLKDPNFIIN